MLSNRIAIISQSEATDRFEESKYIGRKVNPFSWVTSLISSNTWFLKQTNILWCSYGGFVIPDCIDLSGRVNLTRG